MRPLPITGYTSGQRADARAMLAALLAAIPTTKTEADQRARATVATLADALEVPTVTDAARSRPSHSRP
jgi:hypothetical protein